MRILLSTVLLIIVSLPVSGNHVSWWEFNVECDPDDGFLHVCKDGDSNNVYLLKCEGGTYTSVSVAQAIPCTSGTLCKESSDGRGHSGCSPPETALVEQADKIASLGLAHAEELKLTISSGFFRVSRPDWFGYFMGLAYLAKKAGLPQQASAPETAFASVSPLAMLTLNVKTENFKGVFFPKTGVMFSGIEALRSFAVGSTEGTNTITVAITNNEILTREENGDWKPAATAEQLGLTNIERADGTRGGDFAAEMTLYGDGKKVTVLAIPDGTNLEFTVSSSEPATQIQDVINSQSIAKDPATGEVYTVIDETVMRIDSEGHVKAMPIANIPSVLVATRQQIDSLLQGTTSQQAAPGITVTAKRSLATPEIARMIVQISAPAQAGIVSIYYTPTQQTPEELEGKTPNQVFTFNAPGTYNQVIFAPQELFTNAVAEVTTSTTSGGNWLDVTEQDAVTAKTLVARAASYVELCCTHGCLKSVRMSEQECRSYGGTYDSNYRICNFYFSVSGKTTGYASDPLVAECEASAKAKCKSEGGEPVGPYAEKDCA